MLLLHHFIAVIKQDEECCSHESTTSSKTSRDQSRSPQPRSGRDSLGSKGHEADSHSSHTHPSTEKNSGVSPSDFPDDGTGNFIFTFDSQYTCTLYVYTLDSLRFHFVDYSSA